MWRQRKQRNCAYSCADICWSESRHALIFKRRHTQQRSSDSCGPVSGVHDPPHTPHLFVAAIGRSASIDFFAISRISGETTGSALGFFFILVFTIEQIRFAEAQYLDVHVKQQASSIHRLRCRRGVKRS